MASEFSSLPVTIHESASTPPTGHAVLSFIIVGNISLVSSSPLEKDLILLIVSSLAPYKIERSSTPV